MYNHSGRYDGMGHPLTQAVCQVVGAEFEKLLSIYIYTHIRIYVYIYIFIFIPKNPDPSLE